MITTVRAQRDVLKAQLVVEEGQMSHNMARANYYLLQFKKAVQRMQRVKGKLATADQVVGRARMVISDGGYVSALSIPSSPRVRHPRSKSTDSFIFCDSLTFVVQSGG